MFAFYVTGIPNVRMSRQLDNFTNALRKYGLPDVGVPSNWFDAFDMLCHLVERIPHTGKKVIFLDEMPWLDTRKSEFIPALEHFWNSWAAGRPDILVVACGSATSWITNKLLRSKGGLHNRVTMRMNLQPFTLSECDEYFAYRGIAMTRYQIVECHMILGGVPYYLSLMNPKLGFAQNIDRLFFTDGALLEGEYDVLYSSLFASASAHMQVVEALAKKKTGMTRAAIGTVAKISNGGGLTSALRDLELSGFIRRYSGLQGRA
jgi:hypothetical protein